MLPKHDPATLVISITALLTRKQDLLARLEEYPSPKEREELERLLDKVDAELNAVDRPDQR
jgi:hypothetical protein